MRRPSRSRTPQTSPEHEYAEIGRRLLWSRLAIDAEATQQEFARRAKIHRTLYSEWEQGSRRITLDGAIALCKTYNLSLDWIYFGRIGTIDDPHLQRAIAEARRANS